MYLRLLEACNPLSLNKHPFYQMELGFKQLQITANMYEQFQNNLLWILLLLLRFVLFAINMQLNLPEHYLLVLCLFMAITSTYSPQGKMDQTETANYIIPSIQQI